MLSLALLLVAVPAVTLSEGHQTQTRVAVGDTFPEIDGLATARGKKATVVATRGAPEWMNKMLLNDLENDFAKRYADQGVTLVALNGPDSAKGVVSLAAERAKLAKSLGPLTRPRVYVLDPAGKVVWLDIEYSLSTHRELHAALGGLVGE